MNLTPEKVSELKARHKKERDKRICDRIKAVLLINDGYSYVQVAKILLLDDETVRRHVQEYVETEKLINNNKGSISKLNKAQATELIDYLKAHTFMDVRPIIEYIKNKCQITYTRSGITNWLKDHGFTYKKPHKIPAKYNETDIRHLFLN